MNNDYNNLPKDSAGRLMTRKVPMVRASDTIKAVEASLLKNTREMDSINYIYVLSKDEKLKGVLSIKELFRQPKNKKVSSIMNKKIISARSHTDQEKVANLALKNGIKSIPIIDKDNNFLGVVLNDDILKVTYDELREDISRFAGINQESLPVDDINDMPLLLSLKHRLPWLIIGILGGVVAAQIINLFEHTLSENIILAAFIPLVVYIASAVGTQVGYFVVRDLAIDQRLNFKSYFFRQLKVIISMGFIISILIFTFSMLFYKEVGISLVLSLAILLTVLSSIITGLFIPYIFSRLRYDPANASGPVSTIVQDLISVSIYLAVASILL